MKRRESLGLDLTPVIDVVFILLIFFIVTSVFKKDELALVLDLPSSNAKQIEIEGATVPFFKYEENGVTFLQFDSSKSGHPEPMINAMMGLQSISNNEKLVMINSKPPMGLFPKIEDEFTYELDELEDGKAKVVFTKKADTESKTNFEDTACSGGSCSN